MQSKEKNVFRVDRYVDLIGGGLEMAGPIHDGDLIAADTAPGCWGPMITPSIRSGHEVTCPIHVEGAEPGDSIALKIEKIQVLSRYAASGTGVTYSKFFGQDPSIHAKCPRCGVFYPETHLEGIGPEAVKCVRCGMPVVPQTIGNGYTLVYDADEDLAVTVPADAAERIAMDTSKGKVYQPAGSRQHLATVLAKSDIMDLLVRSRPMVGNIGCVPAKKIPSAKNSGDLISGLNRTGLYEPVEPSDLTDGHMDIKHVGEGCVVISPVRVKGGGVYLGDVHLTQGDGELAGHTIDLCAYIEVRATVLKGLSIDSPILLPRPDEYDVRFRPFTAGEYEKAEKILKKYNCILATRRYPIQVVGSGENLNAAIDSAISRASKLTGLYAEEVRNLATISGEVGIGRTSGTVFIGMMLTEETLHRIGILELARLHYS